MSHFHLGLVSVCVVADSGLLRSDSFRFWHCFANLLASTAAGWEKAEAYYKRGRILHQTAAESQKGRLLTDPDHVKMADM